MFQRGSEIAGELSLVIRANPGQKLDDVKTAVDEAFAQFEAEGISEKDLQRIKAQQETNFYNGISSVLGKGFQLAQYQIFAGDPSFINKDIKNILSVSKEDVMSAYNTYLKGRYFVSTSFVPKGQKDLVLSGSEKAEVVEESIIAGAEDSVDLQKEKATYENTHSSFDRSTVPVYGDPIAITPPVGWKDQLKNQVRLFGIENNEVPLVRFSLQVKGGHLLDSFDKNGVANMMARLMNKGTKQRTISELEEVLAMMGASINVSASNDAIVISGNTLSRNFESTMDILYEMLMEPRWDSTEFETEKRNIINQLSQVKSRPNSIATNEFRKILYGNDHIFSTNILGTESTVDDITIDDLKAYYENKLSPDLTSFHVAGAVSKEQVIKSMSLLADKWKVKEVQFPDYQIPENLNDSKVYFYDVPGAKQSVLRFGYHGP